MWINFLINVAIYLGTTIISSLFYKPPNGPRANKLRDFNVPQSREGDAIYDFAGTVWINDAHCVGYGDFSSKGIYKKGGKK